jgi:hypothetical protein
MTALGILIALLHRARAHRRRATGSVKRPS